jgi:hypothetical protein
MLLAGKQRMEYRTNGINSMKTNCNEKDGNYLYICRCNIISATTQWYTNQQMMCTSEFVKLYFEFSFFFSHEVKTEHDSTGKNF